VQGRDALRGPARTTTTTAGPVARGHTAKAGSSQVHQDSVPGKSVRNAIQVSGTGRSASHGSQQHNVPKRQDCRPEDPRAHANLHRLPHHSGNQCDIILNREKKGRKQAASGRPLSVLPSRPHSPQVMRPAPMPVLCAGPPGAVAPE